MSCNDVNVRNIDSHQRFRELYFIPLQPHGQQIQSAVEAEKLGDAMDDRVSLTKAFIALARTVAPPALGFWREDAGTARVRVLARGRWHRPCQGFGERALALPALGFWREDAGTTRVRVWAAGTTKGSVITKQMIYNLLSIGHTTLTFILSVNCQKTFYDLVCISLKLLSILLVI